VSGTTAAVRDLAAGIAKRAEETERERGVPADLLDSLVEAGCYRMLVPASRGGDALTLTEVLEVVETLAAADSSVGWLVGQGAIAQTILGYFPTATLDEVYADGPDVVVAGAVAPKGLASAEGDGWRVTGQWPFVSGCRLADWVYLQSVETDAGTVAQTDDGLPRLRMGLVRADAVKVLDTWHVAGLRGTGSHDVRVNRVLCPAGWSVPFTDGAPTGPDAVLRVSARDLGGLFIAACLLGVARAALQDVVELANGGKRPAFAVRRLAESVLFHDRVGEAEMTLRAARALLYAEAAGAEGAVSGVDRAGLRATSPAVAAMSGTVVDAAYTLAGGSSVYDGAPLQRRMRDLRTATQHAAVGRDPFGALGARMVDPDTD
jgi:alkylation response protein AidB-like acyl-CoA dehydrogenase